MRITLPTGGVYRNESSIINLDNADGPGTLWMAYAKRGDRVVYFDSFGNLPPKELVRYLDVTQLNIIANLINVTIKVTVDNCVYIFYGRRSI